MEHFYEISIIFLIAVIVSTVMKLLKQPLVIGYIFTGIIVGPYLLNILKSVEIIELFSKLGITSLLFIVGLGLSPKVLKELGLVSTITGVGQVVFTSIFGYIISKYLGFGTIESIYIAIALTFSSTIIILKLLSDKGDVGKMYGQISIGFLLVQDLIATIILVTISSLNSATGTSNIEIAQNLGLLILQGLIALIVIFIISTKILSKLTNFISNSQEYLFIASLAWGMLVATLYYKIGLSIEIGALVAGIALSMTPYSYEIASRLRPLRDFFVILFFILLGSQMMIQDWQSLIIPTILFSIFILVGNPLIVLILMNLLGYTKKTGFMAGLTVAQISEFSLILVKLGLDVGHISERTLSIVTLVGILTIAGSTYLILYSEQIYKYIQKYLSIFEFRKVTKNKKSHIKKYDAIIIGYKRAGPEFANAFKQIKASYLAVDFNPDVIEHLENNKIPCEYGDISDVEFLQELPIHDAKIVVSSIPDFETNMLITETIKRFNPKAIIIVIADTLQHAKELYEIGVSNVILTQHIGAKQAANMIMKYQFDEKKYEVIKEKDINYWENIVASA